MDWNKIKYAHMNPPTTRWHYFKVIQLPKLLWYGTGRFVWDKWLDFYHVAIMAKPPYWPDASQEDCDNWMWCRYCGKGGDKRNLTEKELHDILDTL